MAAWREAFAPNINIMFWACFWWDRTSTTFVSFPKASFINTSALISTKRYSSLNIHCIWRGGVSVVFLADAFYRLLQPFKTERRGFLSYLRMRRMTIHGWWGLKNSMNICWGMNVWIKLIHTFVEPAFVKRRQNNVESTLYQLILNQILTL